MECKKETCKEIWKPVVGYERYYEVSNKGNVRSVTRYVFSIKGKRKTRKVCGSEKKPKINHSGYYQTTLSKQGKSETVVIHRIVAEAFIPNPCSKPQVNHIDGDKLNNCVENLEWATSFENMSHAVNVLNRLVIPVSQYDLEGNFIARFNSIKEAGESTGTPRCSISNVLHGRRKKANGFKWKAEKPVRSTAC